MFFMNAASCQNLQRLVYKMCSVVLMSSEDMNDQERSEEANERRGVLPSAEIHGKDEV